MKQLGRLISVLPDHRKRPGEKILFPQLALLPLNEEKPNHHDVISTETKKKCTCGIKPIYLGSFLDFNAEIKTRTVFKFLKLTKINCFYQGMKLEEQACKDFINNFYYGLKNVHQHQKESVVR